MASLWDILMPGGRPLGIAGTRASVREISGSSLQDALDMFKQLSAGGMPTTSCRLSDPKDKVQSLTGETTMDSQILDGLMAECKEDYVGLWAILWEIKHEIEGKSPAEYRAMTLEAAKELLAKGMLVGDLILEKGFQAWPVSREEAVRRIEAGWDNLGRESTIGDIAWFTSPELLELAKRSALQRTSP